MWGGKEAAWERDQVREEVVEELARADIEMEAGREEEDDGDEGEDEVLEGGQEEEKEGGASRARKVQVPGGASAWRVAARRRRGG